MGKPWKTTETREEPSGTGNGTTFRVTGNGNLCSLHVQKTLITISLSEEMRIYCPLGFHQQFEGI
jgi:hypothetical protein